MLSCWGYNHNVEEGAARKKAQTIWSACEEMGAKENK